MGLQFTARHLVLTIVLVSTTSFQLFADDLTAPLFKIDKENLPISFDFISNFDQILHDTRYRFPEKRVFVPVSLKHTHQGYTVSATGKTRARGQDRLKQCDIPPLKVDFGPNSNLQGTAFEGLKGFKLVTSCYVGSRSNEKRRWAYREYIVYKLYEYVTPYSLKVRPANINYRHHDGHLVDKWPTNDFAFIVEHPKQLAKRLGFKKKDIAENTGMDWRQVDFDTYMKLSLFQYMINNTDFGILDDDMRNIDVIYNPNSGKMYPVPYDFDQAEFVRLNKGFSQHSSRWESDHNHICFSWANVSRIIPLFQSLKSTFLAEIDKFVQLQYINQEESWTLKNGINAFFQNMNNGQLKEVVDNTWRKNGCHY